MTQPCDRDRETAEPAPEASQDDACRRLVRCLEENERFRRDSRMGRIFHPGRVSFREISPLDSLHIIFDKGQVSAHVDEVNPLRLGPNGDAGYSWGRVVAHNLSGMAADLGRRLRGRHGEQRCNLGCEMRWVDEDQISEQVAVRTGPGPAPEPVDRCDKPG